MTGDFPLTSSSKIYDSSESTGTGGISSKRTAGEISGEVGGVKHRTQNTIPGLSERGATKTGEEKGK